MVGRSKVWRLSHFADPERLEVQCDLCPTKIKFVGNTTNIARHLELKHPVEFGALTNSDPFVNSSAAIQATRLEQETIKREQENNAIRRILQQHNLELRKLQEKQVKSGLSSDPLSTALCFNDNNESEYTEFTKVWSWHTPISSGKMNKNSDPFFKNFSSLL
ncbi:UNVERIFIED_CONTAM: hypothetical protein RMT77_013422 [Armadillidium vulgare]